MSKVSNKKLKVSEGLQSKSDKLAEEIFEVLSIDKTKSIDPYYIGKKLGVFNSLKTKELLKYDRSDMANIIAEYLLSFKKNNSNVSDVEQKKILLSSLLLPREEVYAMYKSKHSQIANDSIVFDLIARRYGVSTEMVAKRIRDLNNMEAKHNV